MKKTLLIAAAALAAGVISTQAQPVYSQNIVGYVNVSIKPNQFLLVAPQMVDANGKASVNAVMSNGVPDQSTLYIWTGSTYGQTLTYYAGFGWYDSDGNLATNEITPGTGAFIQSGDSSSTNTITIVGNVPTGGFTNTIASGFGVYALPYPASTNIDSSLANFPGQDQDTYFYWDPVTQSYSTTYTYYAGFGWYDSLGAQVYPKPKVGEAFFYQNANGPTNWVTSFQP